MCDHDARDAFMVMKLWTSWKEHANVAYVGLDGGEENTVGSKLFISTCCQPVT